MNLRKTLNILEAEYHMAIEENQLSRASLIMEHMLQTANYMKLKNDSSKAAVQTETVYETLNRFN